MESISTPVYAIHSVYRALCLLLNRHCQALQKERLESAQMARQPRLKNKGHQSINIFLVREGDSSSVLVTGGQQRPPLVSEIFILRAVR